MGGRTEYDVIHASPHTRPWNQQWCYDQLPTSDRPVLGLYPDGTIVIVRRAFVDQHGHSMSNPIGWQELPPVYNNEET